MFPLRAPCLLMSLSLAPGTNNANGAPIPPFLPQTLMVAVMSSGPIARIMKRIGPKNTAVAGLVLVAIGLALLVKSGPDTAYFPQIFAAVLLIGSGAATAFTPLLTIALAGVPAKDAGIGSGIVNVSQQVSAVLSVAILGAVSTSHTASLLASGRSALDALDGGYRLAFVVALISVLLAIVLGSLTVGASTGASMAPFARNPGVYAACIALFSFGAALWFLARAEVKLFEARERS